ncbi:hypothetical protein Hdeb2414_s0423g00890311 [Helianthus debilis subsp. tardiflorus]
MTDPLHENGISFRHALKHVPTHMLYTGITSGILDHMWQIKIDALDGRVFGDDHAEAGAGPSPHIHQGGEVVEAVIDIQDLFHGHGGVIKHAGVENLVESGIFPVILKGRHSVCLVERDSTIQHCIFQMMLYQNTIPIAESKGESKDKLNANGSMDSRSHVTIPKELVHEKPGVDPKSTEA